MSALPGRLVLLGHPVAHSASPRFQNAALRAAGIPLLYEALDVTVEELDATLQALALVNGAGNVTIPHKETVAGRCVRLTPLASRCGAANVFWHEDHILCGDNTDVAGAAFCTELFVGPERQLEGGALHVVEQDVQVVGIDQRVFG